MKGALQTNNPVVGGGKGMVFPIARTQLTVVGKFQKTQFISYVFFIP